MSEPLQASRSMAIPAIRDVIKAVFIMVSTIEEQRPGNRRLCYDAGHNSMKLKKLLEKSYGLNLHFNG